MHNVVIIPARKGSKRIPGKNIKLLNGRPLIEYSLDHALGCSSIDQIVLSTDITEIEDVINARYLQNEKILILDRPKNLAGDHISTEEVLLDTITRVSATTPIDALITLLPTSPFRKSSSIQQCLDIFHQNKADSVSTFSRAKLKIGEYNAETGKFGYLDQHTPARMDLINYTFYDNPCIYVTNPEILRLSRFILGPNNYGYEVGFIEGFDINDADEWIVAEMIASNLA